MKKPLIYYISLIQSIAILFLLIDVSIFYRHAEDSRAIANAANRQSIKAMEVLHIWQNKQRVVYQPMITDDLLHPHRVSAREELSK